MTQNKYDAIICDLGNVLIDFDHRIAVKKILCCTPKKEEDVYDLFFDSGLTEAYEEGKIDTNEFYRRVKEFLKLDMEGDKFFPIWNDIFFETPLNIKMCDFLKGVKSKYKLVLISNLNVTHFEFLKPRMRIFNEFDKLVLSYEVGYRKPAPEIYKVALDFARVGPEKAFYIDDRRDLIEGAGKLGIKGMVFDGEAAFERVKKELI
ncbi:MAG: HAD-IA family hydrolase [Candidatus Omnitrophica bacterium]|nr:HAD-IA family hydrolase [Candidatus Omnitrophota bacterium]